MKTKIYLNNEKYTAGITLKDETEHEQNNMALHVCNSIEQVIENRGKLASVLSCGLDNFVCANQTHSANFYRVTQQDRGRGATSANTAIQDTDALYTYDPNIVLSTFTADCVPVIFYHEQTEVIGVIHSGWQGTVKEITLKIFQHLIEEEKCDPRYFRVHLGPALSQDKFEVDEDVYTRFKQLGYAEDFMYYKGVTGKYHIDNQKTVKKQCKIVGIPSENITIEKMCTFTSNEGFSYRQDKKSGRHLSFIYKKP